MANIKSLRGARNFSFLLRRGRHYETPFFIIKITENRLLFNRLAIIVSKNVNKRAVVRNTLRRRVREWIRTHPPRILSPFDMIIVCKKKVGDVSRVILYEAVEVMLRSIENKR